MSRQIQASEIEAPYLLDGLLHNKNPVEIHGHATETAGATETVFAMFHLFGYRLIPRIRNLDQVSGNVDAIVAASPSG